MKIASRQVLAKQLVLAQETIIRPLAILTGGVSWILRCSVFVVGFGFFFGGGAGPRFPLCLLTEMTVVCVERGHPRPVLVLPRASSGQRVVSDVLGQGEKPQSFVVSGLAAAGAMSSR